jgi:hypothetical protein
MQAHDTLQATMERPAEPLAGPTPPKFPQPVTIWAVVGAVFTVTTLWMVVKWVIGPNFVPVPVGPDSPPAWMKIVLNAGQVVTVALALFNMYWFLVRPWRRSRNVPFEGLLCIGVLIISPWDPVSNYLQTWFTYNSYLFNRGAPIVELPGILTPHSPGAQMAWSIPFIPAVYVATMPWIVLAGCAMMRAAKRRFPNARGLGPLTAWLVFLLILEVVLEGFIFCRLGFYSYAGGWWPLMNAGKYSQVPLNAALVDLWVGAVIAVRYFTNSRGETLAERGASELSGSNSKQIVVRGLAVIGMTAGTIFAIYHVPSAILSGANAHEWPADVKNRSYFLNQCGPRVDRACPGPNVPLSRPGSGYLNWRGQFVGGTSQRESGHN